MHIDPEKVFAQLEVVSLSSELQELLFVRNKYIYSSGVKNLSESVHRVSLDGHRELGVYRKGRFSPITG